METEATPAARSDWRPTAAPLLRHRRDSLMPVLASALSVRGDTFTCVGEKDHGPVHLHPLVAEFLTALPRDHRERFTGRCPEARLLSQFLDHAETQRSRRAARKPFGEQDARRALRGARMTTVRIREDGDPAHGTHQVPCRSCGRLLEHFGVATVSLNGRGA
ncbi:YwqJ-related putative deaminase [Streptacidiphilus monticola]|uniref:YwqJ-related putative deaminase n=1 Tax=Streptacidiphilus monticola TaxID=2161674 RepID=A0ABW1FUK7_9ACTN